MKELREEALRMVAELTGDSIGYTKMQIGMKGHFVTLETAAVSMAERALKAELANREQKATLADRDNHIDLAYKALGDVNRSVYLFDHIREQKAEIERLTKEVQSALSSLAELPRIIAEINQSHVTELASLRASAGEKPEDAWKRAGEAITERFMKQCRYNNEQAILTRSDSTRNWHTGLANMYGSIADELKARPTVYVAPTLPAEEK